MTKNKIYGIIRYIRGKRPWEFFNLSKQVAAQRDENETKGDTMRKNKYHYVYMIIELFSDNVYVGKRSSRAKPEDDLYMGSGIEIKKRQAKYGIENYKKLILKVCNSSEEAYELEAAIVTDKFIALPCVLNAKKGGGKDAGAKIRIKRSPEVQEAFRKAREEAMAEIRAARKARIASLDIRNGKIPKGKEEILYVAIKHMRTAYIKSNNVNYDTACRELRAEKKEVAKTLEADLWKGIEKVKEIIAEFADREDRMDMFEKEATTGSLFYKVRSTSQDTYENTWNKIMDINAYHRKQAEKAAAA